MTTADEISKTYTILEVLGAGSGGVVYKAYHKRLQKEVVLKKINSEVKGTLNQRKEVDMLKNIHHSYLPQVLDFFEVGDDVFTVMNFVPGKSFQQLLSENIKFSQKDVIRWGLQLCSALNYLHQHMPPIIHSDIKPANVMLTPDGNICLIDFNISFFMDENVVLGYTGGYSSPEQYVVAMNSMQYPRKEMKVKIDEKSDIYSLGATLYHILTGKRLRDYREVIDKEMLLEYTSEAFANVIIKSTQNDPKKRFQDAYQMFIALQRIGKEDKRYRQLVWKQRIQIVLICVLFIGSGLTVIKGANVYQRGKQHLYEDIVAQQSDAINAMDYDIEHSLFKQAVKLFPKEVESYEKHAQALSEQGEYVECINFIGDYVENESNSSEKELETVYSIEADSYYELSDYENAVETYQKIIDIGTDNANIYRDYAVALTYNAEEDKAKEILQEAVEKGLGDSGVYYTNGEIAYSSANYEMAFQAFRSCIDKTDDEYLMMRSYIMASKSKEELNDEGGEYQILSEARTQLPQQRQMIVLERLAQLDINLSDESGQDSYRQEAIDVLQEIIKNGWGDYNTYDTLTIQYEKTGFFDEAYAVLESMESTFGIDYNIYKRYAFIEIDKQEMLDNNQRDYRQFADFYKKAESLYQSKLEKNETDDEMILLQNIYMQVQEGGWL